MRMSPPRPAPKPSSAMWLPPRGDLPIALGAPSKPVFGLNGQVSSCLELIVSSSSEVSSFTGSVILSDRGPRQRPFLPLLGWSSEESHYRVESERSRAFGLRVVPEAVPIFARPKDLLCVQVDAAGRNAIVT